MGTPQLPKGYSAEQIKIRDADDNLIAEINDLRNQIAVEARPELPGRPLPEAINDVRKMRSTFEDWTTLVRSPTGELVAGAFGGVNRTGDNEHAYDLEVEVAPSHRRRGIGTWGLHTAAAAATEAGATLLVAWSDSTVDAGEHFARWAGFDLALVERESELTMANLDWDMVERWVADGPKRAPGYALEFVRGVYPRELYEDVIDWQHVMNTAPRDDLQINDEHETPEWLAENEARLESSAKDRMEYIARHVESGAAIGGTNVFYEPWTPTVLWQGATAVHPDHRGHALGKWLKAAMLLKVRELLPEVEVIKTGNAYSNDPMLGINNKLGFQETRAFQVWQQSVEKVVKLLG